MRDPIVLIVEDSLTQAKILAAQLQQHHIEVLLAENGIQALRMVDTQFPDLIVLDINLPDMDGYQICRRLKRDEQTQHIPIIMLTTNDNSTDAIRGLESGADDYIPKDAYAKDQLLSTLELLGFLNLR